MKKIALIGVTTALVFLSACGEKPVAQETNDQPKQVTTEQEKPNLEPNTKKEEALTPKKENGPWTYIEGFHWEDNYNGLKTEINKAVISNKIEISDENGQPKTVSAIGFNFILHNTTQGKFTTYPDQAVLVTSTGEQIEAPYPKGTKRIGGEIDKGVIKEGNVIYLLERGNADKIEWVKLTWNTYQGSDDKLDAPKKKYEIELKIPK